MALLGAALVLLAATVWLEALVVALVTGQGSRAALTAVTRDAGALALAQGLGLGVPVLVAARLRGGSLRTFLGPALAPCPADRIAAAVLAGLALQLPMAELAHRVSELLPALARTPEEEAVLRETMRLDSLYDALMVPLAVIVLAPITEELLFRAFAQRELAARAGALPAVLGVSVLFAAFHGDPTSLPSIFLAGLCLGALAERWRSVRITIAMHAAVNTVPVVLTAEVLPIAGFNDEDPGSHVPALALLVSVAMFAASFGWAMRGTGASTGTGPGAGGHGDIGRGGQPG